MIDIVVAPCNATFDKILSEPSIAVELEEYFKFRPKGYQFSPKFKMKFWDGYIRPYSAFRKTLYCGLRPLVQKFAEKYNYTVDWKIDSSHTEFSEFEGREFIKTLNIPEKYDPLKPDRDYQVHAFVEAVRKGRLIEESATGSGKSLILYLIARYHNCRTLLTTTNTGLVDQLYKDFLSYGCPEEFLHRIYSGQDKNKNAQITISTWQSIYKLPVEWFKPFGLFLGDEVHHYEAKSLVTILEKLVGCEKRVGVTGSLDDGSKTHKMVLQGLFGPLTKIVSLETLMERKVLAQMDAICILLEHPEDIRETLKKSKIEDEVKYLIHSVARNRFITNLTLSLNGNTLVLYRFVESHGEVLHKLISAKTDRPIYFIHGEVKGEERNRISQIVNEENNAIVIASTGTFSEGVNIPNLRYIISTHSYRTKIKTKQSLGRGSRKSDTKTECTWYDIGDDLSWKKWRNHTLKHFDERIELYAREGIPYKMYKVKLGGNISG